MTNRMPVLFVGHGSPMNAIEKNTFGAKLEQLRQELPTPKAILVVSAHWQTDHTQLVGSLRPQTIHDFYGFPLSLSDIQYPAPGAPSLARRIQLLISKAKVTRSWGLDHGAWSVLVHLFPKADVPVLQMSLDQNITMREHYELAQKLRVLRDEGILIVASGNIVHNLRAIRMFDGPGVYDWAEGFDNNIKKALEDRDLESLLNFYRLWPQQAKMAVPTLEHYVPLLYAFAVSTDSDSLEFPVEGFQMASISMRSVLWGKGVKVS